MVQVCSGLNHLRYFFPLQKQLKVAGVLTAEIQVKRHDRCGGRLHNHCNYIEILELLQALGNIMPAENIYLFLIKCIYMFANIPCVHYGHNQ